MKDIPGIISVIGGDADAFSSVLPTVDQTIELTQKQYNPLIVGAIARAVKFFGFDKSFNANYLFATCEWESASIDFPPVITTIKFHSTSNCKFAVTIPGFCTIFVK